MAAVTHKGCESIYRDRVKKLDEERKKIDSQRIDCFQAAGRYLADLTRLNIISKHPEPPTYVKRAFEEWRRRIKREEEAKKKTGSKRKVSEPRKDPKEKSKKVTTVKRSTSESLVQSRKKRALEATRKRFGGEGTVQTNQSPQAPQTPALSRKERALQAVRKRFGGGPGGILAVEMPAQSRKKAALDAVRKRFGKPAG